MKKVRAKDQIAENHYSSQSCLIGKLTRPTFSFTVKSLPFVYFRNIIIEDEIDKNIFCAGAIPVVFGRVVGSIC